MTDELLLRALVSVPVALLLPLGLPTFPGRWCRCLLGGTIVIAGLAGELTHWQAWAIIVGTVAVAAVPDAAKAVDDRRRPARVLAAGALIVLCGAVVATDLDVAAERLEALAESSKVVVVAAGGLAAVFLGGALIGALLHPFAEKMGRREDETRGMENAGRLIGWIERALLYGLVLVGAPGAAALVIAGKAVARFPSFAEERFAEYYLIGSLLSLAIALAAALAVRAIIGLEPLAPL